MLVLGSISYIAEAGLEQVLGLPAHTTAVAVFSIVKLENWKLFPSLPLCDQAGQYQSFGSEIPSPFSVFTCFYFPNSGLHTNRKILDRVFSPSVLALCFQSCACPFAPLEGQDRIFIRARARITEPGTAHLPSICCAPAVPWLWEAFLNPL